MLLKSAELQKDYMCPSQIYPINISKVPFRKINSFIVKVENIHLAGVTAHKKFSFMKVILF